MYLTILEKFGINLRKFTLPRKHCTSFLFLGLSIFWIISTLLGSIMIPSFEITWLKSFPSYLAKFDFFGFKEIPNLLHFRKTYFKCFKCSSSRLEKTEMSSKYITMNLYLSSSKAISISHWNVSPSLIRPNGIFS
jgi:hypothetical protein